MAVSRSMVKKRAPIARGLRVGGGARIRTLEGVASRFPAGAFGVAGLPRAFGTLAGQSA